MSSSTTAKCPQSLDLPHHNHLQIAPNTIIPLHITSPTIDSFPNIDSLMVLLKKNLIRQYKKTLSSLEASDDKKKKKGSKEDKAPEIPAVIISSVFNFTAFMSKAPQNDFFDMKDKDFEYKVIIKKEIGKYLKMRRLGDEYVAFTVLDNAIFVTVTRRTTLSSLMRRMD